jgi:tetratricopeptide (TPR) repeat protein
MLRKIMLRCTLGVALLFVACGPAATHPAARPVAAQVAPTGPRIESEEQYTSARAEFDALESESPQRPGRRVQLEAWLCGQLKITLDGGHLEEAWELLKQALTLWSPSELRMKPVDERLLQAAGEAERKFRHRGAHEEVIVALAVEQLLSPDERPVRERYLQVLGWLRSGGDGESATDDGRERVVEDLEAAAKLWPSPFVVTELTQAYLERPGESALGIFQRRMRRGNELRELIQGGGAQPRSLAYELARLYLRISRPDEAQRLLAKLKGQAGDDGDLRGKLDRYASHEGTPNDAVQLAALFVDRGRDDRDVAYQVCRDATRRWPDAPEPQFCAGQAAYELEQLGAAIKFFERALEIDPTREKTREALARLYQMRLQQIVSDENMDVRELETSLKKVERFHAEHARRFADKPLHPSMAEALFEVGRGYYNVGRLKDAERYLSRSLDITRTPYALEQLAQIYAKKGDGPKALPLYDEAEKLPKGDNPNQLYWRARLRRQIADAKDGSNDAAGAVESRKAALADWDVLLAAGLDPDHQAEVLLEEAKLYYQLDDRDTALETFAKAIDAAPDRGTTYADAIAFLVARGELEEALDAYHRALGRNEVTDYLKVYCSLWIVDLARRSGQPEDPLAAAYLKSTDGGKWYDDLARWATGRESTEQLLSRADSPARKAESSFYLAMRQLEAGKPADARSLWQKVLETDMMAFFEYDMAAYYLKLGRAPSKPVIESPKKLSKRKPDGSI